MIREMASRAWSGGQLGSCLASCVAHCHAWVLLWPPRASLVAQLVKNLPAMWETWVRSLGWEDPLEEGMGTHSNILA